MTTSELLVELKKSLNIQEDTAAFDGVLTQKIIAVVSFMRNAGVSESALESEDVIGAVMVGAGDLWNQNAGEIKFSPVFFTLVSQLALGGD